MKAEEVLQPDEPNRSGPKPIFPILSRLGGGRIPDQMAVELQRLVMEVVHSPTDKPATLSLTLKISKPHAKQMLKGREIIISAELKAKAPDDPPDASLFYFDDDGGLHTRDPFQGDLYTGPQEV